MSSSTTERIAAGIAAAALAIAGAWNALIDMGVSVPPVPSGGNAALFRWWQPIEWQTASVHMLAAVGFLALVAWGGLVAGRSTTAGANRVAWILIAAGALLGALSHFVQFGAQQGVLAASLTTTDPGVLGAIGYTFDRVVAAMQLGGFAAIAVGAFVLGTVALRRSVSTFGVASMVLGFGAGALALFTQADPLDLGTATTTAVALILVPVWAWTAVVRAPDGSHRVAASAPVTAR